MLRNRNIGVLSVTDAGAIVTPSTEGGRDVMQGLARDGRARLDGVLSPGVLGLLLRDVADATLEWRPDTTEDRWFESAALGAESRQAVREALLAVGVDADPARFLRHEPGGRGLPAMEGEARWFVLDLNADWPSEAGGLLLFEAGDRADGWTPKPGGLTLFDTGHVPVLSLVAPSASGARLAVWGRLT
ncbi:MAG TPA: hypothetical protein VGB49_09180 [Caulobacteraceae bacterium]|jgi:hypothetical protein